MVLRVRVPQRRPVQAFQRGGQPQPPRAVGRSGAQELERNGPDPTGQTGHGVLRPADELEHRQPRHDPEAAVEGIRDGLGAVRARRVGGVLRTRQHPGQETPSQAALLVPRLYEQHGQEPDLLAPERRDEPHHSALGVVRIGGERGVAGSAGSAGSRHRDQEAPRVGRQEVPEQPQQRSERRRHGRPAHPQTVLGQPGVPDADAGRQVVGARRSKADRRLGAGRGRHVRPGFVTPARSSCRPAPRLPRVPARPP